MNIKRLRAILWILCCVWMTVIFLFSSQNGEESAKLSGGITEEVVKIVVDDYEKLSASEQTACLNRASFLVRKLAHFSEFALLGFLFFLLVKSYKKSNRAAMLIACISGTLYAVTDELHQFLSDGRSPQVFDVCIDSAGVLSGTVFGLIVIFLLHLIDKKRGKALI